MNTFLDPQTYFIEQGLYHENDISSNEEHNVFDLLHTSQSLDAHCLACERESVFKPIENRPTFGSERFGGPRYIENLKDLGFDFTPFSYISIKKFICTRDDNHQLHFITLIQNDKYQKIGQYPSLKDLNITSIKGFKSILGASFFKEYSMAVGLHSHGVGIGAFLYLRRIVENFVIKPAHEEARLQPDWNESNYQNKRVKQRIAALKDHLPDYFITNSNLYSVLSKGIHELTEDECNKYFPVVNSVMKYILTELKEKSELDRSKIEMTKKLNNISSKKS